MDVAQRPLLDPNALLPVDPYVEGPAPQASGARTFVVGASADSGWQATAVDAAGSAQGLAPVSPPGLLDWSAAFAVPDGQQLLTIWFDDRPRGRWLWAQAAILFILIVLALPSRQQRRDPDADADTTTMAAVR